MIKLLFCLSSLPAAAVDSAGLAEAEHQDAVAVKFGVDEGSCAGHATASKPHFYNLTGSLLKKRPPSPGGLFLTCSNMVQAIFA